MIATVREFLQGLSELVTDGGVVYVCSRRRIDPDVPLSDLDERAIDLLEGTLYYWLSNLPVGGSTEKVSDGGWSHSEGGWTVSKANIDAWLAKYRQLFSKWDEEPLVQSKIRIVNF